MNIVKTAAVADDGLTDNTATFQGEQDSLSASGGGYLFTPGDDRFYGTSAPLYPRPGVTMLGEGQWASRIVNTTTGTNVWETTCIYPGNLHPTYVDSLPYDEAFDISPGDDKITLEQTGAGASYIVGDVIYVRTGAEYTNNNYKYPIISGLNKVSAVNGDVLTVVHEFKEEISGAKICRINETSLVDVQAAGNPSIYAPDDFGFEKISLEGVHAMHMGGNLGMRMFDTRLVGKDGVYGNLISHGQLDTLRCDVTRSGISTSQGSHDTVIRNVDIVFTEATGQAAAIIQPEEGTRRGSILNTRVTGGYTEEYGDAIWFKECWDMVVAGLDVILPQSDKLQVLVASDAAHAQDTHDCRLLDGRFELGEFGRLLYLVDSGGLARIGMDAVTVYGNQAVPDIPVKGAYWMNNVTLNGAAV